MFTKIGWQVSRNHNRDMAVHRLTQPEITRPRGIGIGAGIGGAVGGLAGLVASKSMRGGAMGAATGAALGGAGGEAAHRGDATERAESANYLTHYNNQRMQEIMAMRHRQMMAARQHAANEAREKSQD